MKVILTADVKGTGKKGEIKTLPDQQKQREFVPSRVTLQEIERQSFRLKWKDQTVTQIHMRK